jgi:hypothetical protein
LHRGENLGTKSNERGRGDEDEGRCREGEKNYEVWGIQGNTILFCVEVQFNHFVVRDYRGVERMGILYKDGEINYSLSDWVKGGSEGKEDKKKEGRKKIKWREKNGVKGG